MTPAASASLLPARSLYNNIKAPSQLQPSATYYLFKDGIEPKWEDPKNTHGGSWNCSAPRTPNGKQVLDSWWLHAVSGGVSARGSGPYGGACAGVLLCCCWVAGGVLRTGLCTGRAGLVGRFTVGWSPFVDCREVGVGVWALARDINMRNERDHQAQY